MNNLAAVAHLCIVDEFTWSDGDGGVVMGAIYN